MTAAKPVLRISAYVAVVLLFAIAAILVVNLFDEELTPATTALIASPPLPPPSPANRYIDILGLDAPAGSTPAEYGIKVLSALKRAEEPGFAWSEPWELAASAWAPTRDRRHPWSCGPPLFGACGMTREALDKAREEKNAADLPVFRTLRDKAEFAELVFPDPYSLWVNSSAVESHLDRMKELHRVDIAAMTDTFERGQAADALAEWQKEVEFGRSVLAGARSSKMKETGFYLLWTDVQWVSVQLRANPAKLAPYRDAIAAALRPLRGAEADTVGTLLGSESLAARRLADRLPNEPPEWTWWQRAVIHEFFHPHASANLFSQRVEIWRPVLTAPNTDVLAQVELAKAREAAFHEDQTRWTRWLYNPIGRYLTITEGRPIHLAAYRLQLMDLQGYLALVALQNQLGSATGPDAVKALLAGEAGKANPYTGRPMDFDPDKRVLSFESPDIAATLSGRVAPHIATKQAEESRISVPLYQ